MNQNICVVFKVEIYLGLSYQYFFVSEYMTAIFYNFLSMRRLDDRCLLESSYIIIVPSVVQIIELIPCFVVSTALQPD